MALILKSGSLVKTYTIVRELNRGNMAVAYEARDSGGVKVFLKQYKSPGSKVKWYRAYQAYQAELKRRVENSEARNNCYRFIEFFEFSSPGTGQAYYQVFEFIDAGKSLEDFLAGMKSRSSSVPWETRLTLAKVLVAGIAKLHEAKIVHCDLKPGNVELIRDEAIAAGYRLKLVDMDFSLLADQRAPWDGEQGYIGSPNYHSPEHLRGDVPTSASDVFTCGLMLYEILAGDHPYWAEDDEVYCERALAGRAAPPVLEGRILPSENHDAVVETIHRCLSPDPKDRPSAQELHTVLKGGKTSSAARGLRKVAERAKGTVALKEKSGKSSTEATINAKKIVLVSPVGSSRAMSVRTEVGAGLLKRLGEEACFCSAHQFTLQRDGGESWVLVHCDRAKHQTLVNGRRAVGAVKLKEGDIIGIGDEDKKIVKLPLTVRFE